MRSKTKNQAFHLINIANGIDNSEVVSYKTDPKCISTTSTLPFDARSIGEIVPLLKEQAEKIGLDLRRENKYAYVVAAICKNKDFQNSSKQIKLAKPTNISKEIFEISQKLLSEIWDKSGVRLVGIRVSSLVTNYYYQPSFFESNDEVKRDKEERLEKVIDKLKDKYGVNKINKGI